jgi:hypothetical protein
MNIVDTDLESIERRRSKKDALLRIWHNPDFQVWLEADVYSRVEWYKEKAMTRDLATEQGRHQAEHDLVAAKTVQEFVVLIQTVARQDEENRRQFEKRSE